MESPVGSVSEEKLGSAMSNREEPGRRGLVYILCPSYSGSTLLSFLIGTHPRIATVGELKATSRGDMEQYKCSCDQRLLECGFWRKVKDDVEKRGISLDLHDLGTHFACPEKPWADKVLRASYRGAVFEGVRRLALQATPAWRKLFQGVLDKNRELMDVILRLQRGDIFLDSSKDPIRLKYFLDDGRWTVKAIRLLRDGRGSTSSYMRIKKLSLPEASREWREAQRECDRLAEDLPPRSCLTLRYEDLCANVDGELRRVFDFIGVDPGMARRDFLSVEHHILGHAMRLRTNGQIELNEKWKATWSREDLATFHRVAGDVNRKLGYA